jgi:hypothetical protein
VLEDERGGVEDCNGEFVGLWKDAGMCRVVGGMWYECMWGRRSVLGRKLSLCRGIGGALGGRRHGALNDIQVRVLLWAQQ